MKKNILFFMEDPGAANGMIHLIEPFQQHGFNIEVFVTGHAKEFLAQREVRARSADSIELSKFQQFCEKYDAVFIGNSENRKSISFSILDISKKLGIISFCFVDSSVNHRHRFAGLTSNPLEHMPDYIFVPDEDCKKLYLGLGFKEKVFFHLVTILREYRATTRCIKKIIQAFKKD